MRDDLFSPDVSSTSRPRRNPIARLGAERRLRRRDRFSAELAAAHGAISGVEGASLLVELGWAAGRGCTACAAGRRHGGATGSRLCLVGALRIALDGDAAAVHRATDLVWQQLYRGQPRRTVNWHSPAGRHAMQVQDLRSWNDHAGRTASQVGALVRATLHTARVDLARAREQADALVPVRV